MRATIALAIVIGWSLPAHAGNDVGVIVTGESSMLAQTLAHFESWLSQRGHRVVAAPLPSAAITEINECFTFGPAGCARNVVDARAKSHTLIYVQAETRRETRDVTLTVYWFDRGHPPIVEHGTCGSCTDVALSAVSDDLLTKLARAARAAVGKEAPRRSSVLPFTAMATGAAAVIAGGVMIAIDREPGRHAPPTIHTSAPAGLGISIAGTVIAGIGAYLWFRNPVSRSSPVAAVTGDTAYLGWLERF